MESLPIASIIAAIRRDLNDSAARDTASVRAVRRKYSRALKQENPQRALAVVIDLVRSGVWKDRLVGFELLPSHPAAFRKLNDELVEQLADGLADWGSIDLFGVSISGPAWRQGLVSDARISAWAQSSNRWRRRLALVSTVPLNSKARGGSGDASRTLSLCRQLKSDRDDMVVKAMSWALRELATRDPVVVAGFVRDEGPELSARVRREVTNKLTTGLKTPRKRQGYSASQGSNAGTPVQH
jgi:3-methyladenine DNA glycosylase AlkD